MARIAPENAVSSFFFRFLDGVGCANTDGVMAEVEARIVYDCGGADWGQLESATVDVVSGRTGLNMEGKTLRELGSKGSGDKTCENSMNCVSSDSKSSSLMTRRTPLSSKPCEVKFADDSVN